MLGQRRETPRWANDLVLQKEMLGQKRGTPRWADELVVAMAGIRITVRAREDT